MENAAGETVSPPRHTASAGAAAAGPTYAVLQDHELVLMLRQKPKNTLNLRTTASFQQYFSGIARTRMLRLLELAYSETADEADRKEKVEKRMRLLDGFMV